MNRTILALLFTFALTGSAQACHWNNFGASAEAVAETQNNPVPPPVAEQAIETIYSAGVTSTFASWRHKIKTLFDTRIQEGCLTTAIYFEARSESQLGQLAVATVILNRAKASSISSSICRVVYKGASHLNACQFSFACDGKPDLVDDARAWKTARAISALALTDDRKVKDGPMRILASATNYHADYVDPYWSKSLNRLTKIGRHIFYSQG
jgi:spore germination cell wall hydrolase CwlJ-like protein